LHQRASRRNLGGNLCALERHTLAVRTAVCPNEPYAIGLRLSDAASRELIEPERLLEFQRWLDRHGCYVFTINGFPFGRFHGTRVKEQVYAPDWTAPSRLAYTNRLLICLPCWCLKASPAASATLPGSFQGIHSLADQEKPCAGIFGVALSILRPSARELARIFTWGWSQSPWAHHENTPRRSLFFMPWSRTGQRTGACYGT